MVRRRRKNEDTEKIFALLLAVMLTSYLTACQSKSDDNNTVSTLDAGLLGTSIKPVGVLVADANGYFDEEGVGIDWSEYVVSDEYTDV
ncbi:MAG: hypothetical protein ACI4XJ_10530 [Eubacteriales bacterium]